MKKKKPKHHYQSQLSHYHHPIKNQSILTQQLSNQSTTQSHTLKHIPHKKSTIQSSVHSQKSRPLSFTPILIHHTVDSHIDQLVSNLYPKLNDLQLPQPQIQTQFPTLSKRPKQKSPPKFDINSHTWLQKFQKSQNDNLIKSAQKQLARRLKSRANFQSKNLPSQHQSTYSQLYTQLKQHPHKYSLPTSQQQIFRQTSIKFPQQGIRCYSQIKNKPAIINYIKSKFKSRNLYYQQYAKQQLINQQRNSLKALQCRIKKFMDRNKKKSQEFPPPQDQQQQYLANIQHVTDRLRKIYTRKQPYPTNQISQQQLTSSQIFKHQYQILQHLNSNTQTISKQSKQQLLKKFNQILNIFNRSFSPGQQKHNKNKNSHINKSNLNNSNQPTYSSTQLKQLTRIIQNKIKIAQKSIQKLDLATISH